MMLVLTRKIEEELLLKKDGVILAVVKVVDIDRNQVRIGIDAGKDIVIVRRELEEKAKPNGGQK